MLNSYPNMVQTNALLNRLLHGTKKAFVTTPILSTTWKLIKDSTRTLHFRVVNPF